MGKRLIVDSNFLSDFNIIGIAYHLYDYQLSFHLNKSLQINLKKTADFKTFTLKGESLHSFSFANYADFENRIEFYLVSNHDQDGLLIPALKQIDFFLIIQGIENMGISGFTLSGLDDLIQHIRIVPNILAAYEIQKNNIKGIDVIISDIELHLLDIEKH